MATTTRKRARNTEGEYKGDDPTTPHINEAYEPVRLPVSVEALAAFIGDDHADHARLERALNMARAAAETLTGQSVGATASHAIRQGINLLASHLLLTNQLEQQPPENEIPLVVRAFWRQASAGHQPV